MIEALRDPETYCTQTIPSRIDFTLWTERNQYEGCTTALEEVSNLTPLGEECIDDFDAESCDPCSKISDSMFEKYRQFVQSNMLAVMSTVSETELGVIEIQNDDL